MAETKTAKLFTHGRSQAVRLPKEFRLPGKEVRVSLVGASAIDTELPKAPSSVHLLLRDKAGWVEPQIGPNDDCFDGYPELSIEDWHKNHGLWIE